MRSQRYRCALSGAFLLAAVGLVGLPSHCAARSPFNSGVVDAIDRIVDLMADSETDNRSRADMRHLRHAVEQLLDVLDRPGHHHHHGHMHKGFVHHHHHAGKTIGSHAGRIDAKADCKKGQARNAERPTTVGNQVGKNANQKAFVDHRESQPRVLAPGCAKAGHAATAQHAATKKGGAGAHQQGGNVCACKTGGGPQAHQGSAKNASANNGPNSKAKPCGGNGGKQAVRNQNSANIGARPGQARICNSGKAKSGPGQAGGTCAAKNAGGLPLADHKNNSTGAAKKMTGPATNQVGAKGGNVVVALNGQNAPKQNQAANAARTATHAAKASQPAQQQYFGKLNNKTTNHNLKFGSLLTAARSTPMSAQTRSHAGSTVGQRPMGHAGKGKR